MSIEFHCPYCTATVRVGDAAAGKIGRCPKCDTRVRVPAIPFSSLPTGTIPPPDTNPPLIQINPPQAESRDSGNDRPFPGIDSASESRTDSHSGSGLPGMFSGQSANGNSPPIADDQQTFIIPNPSQREIMRDLSTRAPEQKIGQLPIVSVTDDPVTSKYLKRKKKKRSANYAGLIPPVLFGGIFAIIAFSYYQWTRPSYVGALAGERMNPNQSIRIELEGNAFNIDQKIFTQIVDEVRERPSAVASNLVNLRFAAGAKGLEISLRPGNQADLIKVPVTQLKPIDSFYRNQFDALDNARLAELQAGLVSLSSDWVKAPEGTKNDTLPNYRNSVVYNSFVKGLGRISEARIGKIIYPCVHEDGAGNLYFLVPLGTESFTIAERNDLGTKSVFPSELKIEVRIQLPPVANPELVPVESELQSVPDPAGDSTGTYDLEPAMQSNPEMKNDQ